jgi:NADPH2:quinone reductase
MKAAVYHQTGGPEVLKYEDVPDPELHRKGIIIRVEAIAVEGGDTLNRQQGQMPATPHIVGYQAAGEVIAVGEEVQDLKVGQKVATTGNWGSHAELRAVPARTAWPIPDGLDVKRAAVVPVTFGTAHDCLFEFGRLKAGETVLVQAGASGVGVAAIQLAKRAGATVIATASSDERLERLKPLGLDHGINYRRDDVVAEVRRLTDKKGVDVVVDPVGGSTLQGSVKALGYRGRLSWVGSAGRETVKLDVGPLMAGNRTLSGVFLGAELGTQRVRDMLDRSFPLSEAAAAHAYIESRAAVGRVLLIP